MTTEADNDRKKRAFRLSDMVWIVCFVGLAVVLIVAAILLWETWQISTLSRQFLGR